MATNKDVEKSKPSYTAGGKIAGTETVWHFLKQLNTELPYGSGIPLRYLPREMGLGECLHFLFSHLGVLAPWGY